MSPATGLLPLLLVLLMVGGCLSEEGTTTEKEADSKATESQQVTAKAEVESSGGEKGKRAPSASVAVAATPNALAASPAQTKVMIMPPVSLMIAMPHPSGRFLMLFPTTQVLPVLPMPYAHMSGQHSHPQASHPQASHSHQPPAPTPSHHHDHPAMFAARHQMLYSGPNYQNHHHHQQQHRDYYPQQSSYHPYHGYKRMSTEVN